MRKHVEESVATGVAAGARAVGIGSRPGASVRW